MRNAAGQPQGTAVFKPVRADAGGFVSGISIAANGDKVIRTDVGGAYIKKAADKTWRQLLTAATLPVGEYAFSAGYVSPGNLSDQFGAYEAVIAPSDSNRVYIAWNARLYRTENGGTSLIKCGLADTKMYVNSGADRLYGKKIAIDNQNPDVFVLGTQANGLYYSANKGATMTQVVIGANTGSNPNPHLVACDPVSTVTSGIRQRWFAVRQGTGVYVSTTGPGGTYTLMSGSPTDAWDMKFDASGNCYVVSLSGNRNVYKCAAGGTTWTQFTGMPNANYSTIAIKPSDVNHIVVLDTNAFAAVSTDGGATWLNGGSEWFANYPFSGSINAYAYSIPWLGMGKGVTHFPSIIEFDPATAGRLWSAEGLGVRRCTAPTTANNDATGRFDWIEESEGIYELVSNTCVTPPGGSPVFSFWDKPVWTLTNPDVPPRGFPPPALINGALGVQAGWEVDYAKDDPTWLAAYINFGGDYSGLSTDRSLTWQRFPTSVPFNGTGGCMAVGLKNNVIVIPSNNGHPIYTKNGGSTWPSLPGPWPAQGSESGFGYALYFHRHIITYDDAGAAFYLQNYGPTGATSLRGIWKSTDQGDSWTQVFSGGVTSGDPYHCWLRAVPGQAGHLFWTAGYDQAQPFKRSTDGGVTWSTVTNVQQVASFGFGKAAPGKSYPSIYIVGYVSSVYGTWRSDDNCVSWIKLASFPMNVIDQVTCVNGDLNIYGRCYVGFGGSGFVYCDYSDKVTLA